MASTRTKRIVLTSGALTLAAVAGAGVFVFLKYQEERQIYRKWLEPVLASEADQEYSDLPLLVRHATALRGMHAVAELRDTEWISPPPVSGRRMSKTLMTSCFSSEWGIPCSTIA